jgi:hypothetical protein
MVDGDGVDSVPFGVGGIDHGGGVGDGCGDGGIFGVCGDAKDGE